MAELPGAPSPPELRFEIPPDLTEIRGATQKLCSFLAERGLGDPALTDCNLAFVEACNNAIKYASPTAGPLPVMVEARCDENEIELRITDHTAGFDWPEKATLPEPHEESGRGLFLIQSLMDYAHYSCCASGNVLELRKKRRPAMR
jgi:anti-sigma regulatory factor (Ser/Thr protein kinase)